MTATSLPVFQTLSWARAKGFKPVPLHPESKAAIFKDYTNAGYQPPGDEYWKSKPFGVGIVTGPRANGPVDIDLDCPEALAMASYFLPETPAVFGRKSKPRSHWLYIVDTAESPKVAYNDVPSVVDGKTVSGTLVEMRGDGGHQTVFPGSIHEQSKEIIEWSGVPFPDVSRVSHQDLETSVKRLAVACLVARHIWLPGQRNEAVKHLSGMLYYLEWAIDDVVNLIMAVQDFWNDKDKTRVITARNTYRNAEQGRKITGAKSLRKLLGGDAVIDRIMQWIGNPATTTITEYNERFAVVDHGGKFRIAKTDVGAGNIPIFYGKDDFIALYSTDYTTNSDGKITTKPAMWLKNPRRRQYNSVDFIPGLHEDADVLNLWQGWSVEASDDQSKCAAWLELLREYICGGDESLNTWVLHWFANIVREPVNKSLTCPVIIGPQGAGKSLLVNYFGKVLGSGFVTVTNPDHVHGKFNQHTATCLLMHSEEALYGGDKKHRGIIKSLITDETRMFEAKGVDAKIIKNHMRLILTSNEAHAAPAEVGDRRFTVIDLRKRKASPELIKRVVHEMNNGGPASLLGYLLNMQYDPAIPRANVKNEALEAMKNVGLNPVDEWWKETLSNGILLPDWLSWSTDPAKGDWPAVVGSVTLYKLALETLKSQGVRSLPSPNTFYQQLSAMLGVKLRKQRRQFTHPGSTDGLPQWVSTLPERQTSILNFPSLRACRKAFESHLGQKVEWPGMEPSHEKLPWQQY